jgi:Tfp pilus assembly protein PilZ
MFRTLRVEFASLIDFQREYQRNIANGGVFVETREQFEFREVVEVELALLFCGRIVPIQSEVVGRADAAAESERAVGVALQFLDPIDELRALFSELVGIAPGAPDRSDATWLERDGPTRRHERSIVYAPIQLFAATGVLSGHTRNLSRSGALVTVDEGVPPRPGEALALEICHPRTGRAQRIPARVLRNSSHVRDRSSVALIFEIEPADEEHIAKFIQEICVGHGSGPMEAITGPIQILGLPSLVQMFSSGSEGGTLTVHTGEASGRVVFASGGLHHASVGPVTGLKALSRLLTWKTGRFEFVPVVDPADRADEATPMYGAVLEAVQYVDELARLDLAELPLAARVHRAPGPTPDDVEKLESEVLALAEDEISVAHIVDATPVFDAQVYACLLALLERGLLELKGTK